MTSSAVGADIDPLAHIFILIHDESPTLEDFTIHSQVRHVIWPNQVHFITDWLFIFSCSPPRLTATQLLSITGKQHLATEGLAPSRCYAFLGAHRGRDDALVYVAPPSEPDVRISRFRLSG